jgi:RNA polymerase sigma-70 factor (ECF subfamily)
VKIFETRALTRGTTREAFSELVEGHRRELQVHCYRMLGSVLDAEDLVQETLLRAWKSRDSFEGRAPLRAWLYKIATNACLDELANRPRRGLPPDLYPAADPNSPLAAPVSDPIWLDPYPDGLLGSLRNDPAARYDLRESITLAFLVALQTLPPRQRAILLMRDVVGLRASEVADLLEDSVSAVNSALYRARLKIEERFSKRGADSPMVDGAQRGLLDRYVAAWEAADIDGLVQLLKEDASFPMPPLPTWVKGRAAIREFVSRHILDGDARGRWRLIPTQANGQPAFAWYRRRSSPAGFTAFAIQVVTIEGGWISDATTFGGPQLFSAFGLPPELESDGRMERPAASGFAVLGS